MKDDPKALILAVTSGLMFLVAFLLIDKDELKNIFKTGGHDREGLAVFLLIGLAVFSLIFTAKYLGLI